MILISKHKILTVLDRPKEEDAFMYFYLYSPFETICNKSKASNNEDLHKDYHRYRIRSDS